MACKLDDCPWCGSTMKQIYRRSTKLYNVFNKEFFGGQLPLIPILKNRNPDNDDGTLAFVLHGEAIYFTRNLIRGVNQYRIASVLLHEMIHIRHSSSKSLWTHAKLIFNPHGKDFEQERTRIMKQGVYVSAAEADDDQQREIETYRKYLHVLEKG